MRLLFVILLLLLTACGSTGKKVYPKLDPVTSSIKVAPLWVAKVGEKLTRQHRQLSVAVTEDRVYAASAKGKLIALKQNGGEILWTRPMVTDVSCGPKVDGDVLYVGTGDAHLTALDANSGDILWRIELSSEVLANPAVNDDKVFVHTIDGKLTAYNKTNGEKVWVDSHDVPALTLRGTSSPVVVGDRVISGYANGKLVALDVETGRPLWESVVAVPSGRTDLQRMVDIDGLLQVDGDEIYAVTYQGRLAAISVENGRSVWTRDMSSFTGVAMDKKQLYLTDADGHVWAVDRRTGATLWRQDTLEGRDVTGPVVLGNTVVVADGAGLLHWLSTEDGAFVARHNLAKIYDWAFVDWGDENRSEYDFGVTSTLEVANDRLYVRNNMGALSVFALPASMN